MVIDGTSKADNHHLEESSAALMGAIKKVLDMLGDLSERRNQWTSPKKKNPERAKNDHRGQFSFRPLEWKQG